MIGQIELDNTSARIAQQIFEENGFLILACFLPKNVGDILPSIWVAPYGVIDARAKVIEIATMVEFTKQHLKYFPELPVIEISSAWTFVKVIAE